MERRKVDKQAPTGRKDDNEKARLDLIPPEAELEEGYVWGFGAKKYAAHNFRGGIEYSRLIGAAMRHLNAIRAGEDLDPESGRKHWAHVRCCMGMLAAIEAEHPELDDRYKNAAKVDLETFEKAIQEFAAKKPKKGKRK